MRSAHTPAQWLRRLVQIPSVNPHVAALEDGAPGEKALAEQIASWFTELGGNVCLDEVMPDRPNVYGIWTGRSDRWIAVDVHMDTVSAAPMSKDKFSGRIANQRVYGRGAVDTKASLGIILTLLEQMQRLNTRPGPNLLVGATVDEEIGATGAPAFARWMAQQPFRVEQIAVAEPTCCRPVYGHKGVVRLEFDIAGKSAHSSQPHRGQNAVVAAAKLIAALDQEDKQMQRARPASALGSPTLTVSVVRGGSGINVVPDSCHVALDRRVVDYEDAKTVADDLVDLARAHCDLPFQCRRQKELDAFYQEPDTPWVQQLARWSDSSPQVVPYGTNAWAYHEIVEQRIVIGPGSIDQAHGAEEWVELSELKRMADVYTRWWDPA